MLKTFFINIESIVLSRLSNIIFDKKTVPALFEQINKYLLEKEKSQSFAKKNLEGQLSNINKQIDNIVDIMVDTGSKTLIAKLETLEKEKIVTEDNIHRIERDLSKKLISKKKLTQLFGRAQKLFESGTLAASKQLIDLFVDSVYVYKDKIEIKLNILPNNRVCQVICVSFFEPAKKSL